MYLQNMSFSNTTQFQNYQKQFTAGGFNPMLLTPGEFFYYFADIFAGMVQTGQRVLLCNTIKGMSIQ